MDEWTRIPAPLDSETDRRTLTAIGLEVRIVKIRLTKSGTPRKYIEYREQVGPRGGVT